MFGVILNQQTWLPLTQGWIHTQAAYLPSHVVPYVVCGETDNLPQFELPRMHAWSRLSWRERVRALAGSAGLLGSGFSRRAALLAQVARRHGAEVVHSHFGYTGYHAARVVRRLGLRHVVTFYGVDMSALPRQDPRWRARYRVLFERVDQVLCEGPCMAAGVAALGCPPEKLRVHHLGVRLDDLHFNPRRWRPGEPLRVLIAASFREKKGIPSALEALARVKDEVSLEITVVGDAGSEAKSKAEKVRILEVVANCRLAPHVRFVGYQPWRWLMEEAYRNHIFMSPSVTAGDGDTEGGAPVGLIEMAATGMPVVSSRHADIPEVIEHGVGGWLAGERNIDELEQCLRRLIDAPEEWETLVRAARGRIEREFNAEKQGVALAEIYERVRHV